VLISINQKIHVGGMFCDLAKTFDCVSQEMLSKLHFYGIQGIAAEWFTYYLADRKQGPKKDHLVTLKFFFKLGTIKHGVPQGSIPGALVFHNIPK
jgi:hypothetical protein